MNNKKHKITIFSRSKPIFRKVLAKPKSIKTVYIWRKAKFEIHSKNHLVKFQTFKSSPTTENDHLPWVNNPYYTNGHVKAMKIFFRDWKKKHQ